MSAPDTGLRASLLIASLVRLSLQFVPFFAVAAANYSNVLLMRWNERKLGIDVFDADQQVRGKSREAGATALNMVALSRVLIPVPVMTVPPVIFYALNQTALFARRPWLRTPMNLCALQVNLFHF